MNHGVYASRKYNSGSAPVTASSGIPFVIGAAPIQCADAPTPVGVPVLCKSFEEAVQKLGYSEEWDKYQLCEFMYSHFKLFKNQPVIFCNVLDLASMRSSVATEDMSVENHKIILPLEAINDDALIVKPAGGSGEAYIANTDYAAYYNDDGLIIELLSGGDIYSVSSLSVAYGAVKVDAVTANVVATGLEAIEMCMGVTGTAPDLICAPGFSHDPAVAAVMAIKAAKINGIFAAKALIDISSATDGADEYTKAVELKNQQNLTDEVQIVCWPMLKLGDKKFHMSTQLAGLMAQVDAANNSCPYESPSNKAFRCDAFVLKDDTVVQLTLPQANTLNAGGVVTALSFLNEIKCWGNYTACYPAVTDADRSFIPVSRMCDWIGNTEVLTFWSKVDKPMSRRLIDSIVDSVNIWLNGLTGAGYLLGGTAKFYEEENPPEDLVAGIFRIHNIVTPPSPGQETEFITEYDASAVAAALL